MYPKRKELLLLVRNTRRCMDILFHPLDAILGTPSKVRLLRELVPIERPVSGREAARLAGLSSYSIRALDELVEMGLVLRQEATGQHLFRLNRENYLAEVLSRLFMMERERTAAIFAALRDAVEECDHGAVLSAVIFGSAARGDAAPGSDLDLLVVTSSAGAAEEAYSRLVDTAPDLERRFGLALSPVVITQAQARAQISRDDPFLRAVLREGRLVVGAELSELLADETDEEDPG